jgi:hypothetical protein
MPNAGVIAAAAGAGLFSAVDRVYQALGRGGGSAAQFGKGA